MPWLESAAVTFLVPAGCQRDPTSQPGLAKLTAEMLQRGCGDLQSRELEQAMDQLGLARSTAVTNYHTRLSAAMPAVDHPPLARLILTVQGHSRLLQKLKGINYECRETRYYNLYFFAIPVHLSWL